MRITVELTDSQLAQLDGARGDTPRRQHLQKLIAGALDRVYPSSDTRPEDMLKLMLMKPGGVPVPDDHYPSVEELAPYVPFPFPPPADQDSGGGYQAQRHAAWRAAWACYMENAGWDWPAITKKLGYANTRQAQAAASRHTVRYSEKAAAERRQEMRERLARLREVAWQHIIDAPYKFTVGSGALVVNPDGTPARDEDIRLRYLDVALKIEERQAKVDGSDPRDAQRIEAGNLDYQARINELIGQFRTVLTQPVVAGELESSVADDDQDESSEP